MAETEVTRAWLMDQAQNFFGPKFIYLGDVVDFGCEVRHSTAKAIAQKLRESAKAMRVDFNYLGAEALEDAAKLIEREYEVK